MAPPNEEDIWTKLDDRYANILVEVGKLNTRVARFGERYEHIISELERLNNNVTEGIDRDIEQQKEITANMTSIKYLKWIIGIWFVITGIFFTIIISLLPAAASVQ